MAYIENQKNKKKTKITNTADEILKSGLGFSLSLSLSVYSRAISMGIVRPVYRDSHTFLIHHSEREISADIQ